VRAGQILEDFAAVFEEKPEGVRLHFFVCLGGLDQIDQPINVVRGFYSNLSELVQALF
jgi:hypothetical protein